MSTFRRPVYIPASKLPPHLASSRIANPPGLVRAPIRRMPAAGKEVIGVQLPVDQKKRSIVLTLPVPPSVNHQYATVNGRRLLSVTGRSYKAQVGQLIWLRLAKSPDRALLLAQLQTSPLALSIRFYFTSLLRRDVDGGLKIAQDALCEGLGVNDNRIVETHLYKHVDKSNPRIEVRLTPTSPS